MRQKNIQTVLRKTAVLTGLAGIVLTAPDFFSRDYLEEKIAIEELTKNQNENISNETKSLKISEIIPKEMQDNYIYNPNFNENYSHYLSRHLRTNPEGVIGTLMRKRIEFIKSNPYMRSEFDESVKRLGKYLPTIIKIFEDENVPKELAFLVLVESNGKEGRVESPMGAIGPFQFIEETALENGLKIDGDYDERLSAILSAKATASHLKNLHENFNDWCLAIKRYNSSKPDEYKSQSTEKISCANYLKYVGEKLRKKSEIEVLVRKGDNLKKIFARTDYPFDKEKIEDILFYNNLESERNLRVGKKITIPIYDKKTPEYVKENIRYLPRLLATLKLLEEYYPDVLNTKPSKENFEIYTISHSMRNHTVKRGERLDIIAANYVDSGKGNLIKSIKWENNLEGDKLKAGQVLVIPYPTTLLEFAIYNKKDLVELKKMNPHILNQYQKLPDGARIITY
jgi:hypothetical protein